MKVTLAFGLYPLDIRSRVIMKALDHLRPASYGHSAKRLRIQLPGMEEFVPLSLSQWYEFIVKGTTSS